ncbi:hypothetical protein DSECCO2_536090 [anaerobic digester metagenome]
MPGLEVRGVVGEVGEEEVGQVSFALTVPAEDRRALARVGLVDRPIREGERGAVRNEGDEVAVVRPADEFADLGEIGALHGAEVEEGALDPFIGVPGLVGLVGEDLLPGRLGDRALVIIAGDAVALDREVCRQPVVVDRPLAQDGGVVVCVLHDVEHAGALSGDDDREFRRVAACGVRDRQARGEDAGDYVGVDGVLLGGGRAVAERPGPGGRVAFGAVGERDHKRGVTRGDVDGEVGDRRLRGLFLAVDSDLVDQLAGGAGGRGVLRPVVPVVLVPALLHVVVPEDVPAPGVRGGVGKEDHAHADVIPGVRVALALRLLGVGA